MTSDLRKGTDQIKNRPPRNLGTSRDTSLSLFPVPGLDDVDKVRRLPELYGRGLLYADCWTTLRVLIKTKFHVFRSEGSSGNETAVGAIDFTIFTHCQEVSPKETRKASRKFVICREKVKSRASGRHGSAAPAATMSDWLKKVRAAVRSAAQERRRAGASLAAQAALRPSSCAADPLDPRPAEGAARPAGLTRPRSRGPGRRRQVRSLLAESSSQPSLLADSSGQPRVLAESSSQPSLLPAGAGGQPASPVRGLSGGHSSAYEYSSSEESLSSAASSRCSVVRRLNTTMPEIALPRRSCSPVAAAVSTSASNICHERAAAGGPSAPGETSAGRRSSVGSLVAPLRRLESEFGALGSGGASSTCSSSLTNLTTTLTREGQAVPALAAGLGELRTGLQELSDRLTRLSTGQDSAQSELAVTRADIAAVQGSVTSLQTLVASLNNRMSTFSNMFRKVDEQLLEMWAEMDTVNNNVHHVMHKALEYQQQNERMFGQLEQLRAQLLTAFPEQLRSATLPRAQRGGLAEQRRARARRGRRESERLCEIDDPASDEPASSAAGSRPSPAAAGDEAAQ